ncbi:uncharacterized protein LOC134844128 [Symsagittifera roscoffensis]|uniref:uncharacterized protein LOC134844128 n=1 Tax=Symsagittifera roscoffensis TaxID=84072 RepID=UPI00307C642F
MNSLIASNCCGQNGLAFTSGTRKILVRTGNGDEKRKDNYHFLNLKKDKDLASQQFMDSPERKLLVRHGSSVKSMRRTFEMFELKTETKSDSDSCNKSDLRNPFESVEKCEQDSREKEDNGGRKRRQRISEFISEQESRSPAAKRAKSGTVYDTIKHFALSEDKNSEVALRKAMKPSESYQLLLEWINNRIKHYSAFLPQICDLSVATFNCGSVLAALAHSFNPFGATSYFQLTKRTRRDKFIYAWDAFREMTGEAPVYSLDDALNSPSQKLDRKCLLAMLFLIREKVILLNLKQYRQ